MNTAHGLRSLRAAPAPAARVFFQQPTIRARPQTPQTQTRPKRHYSRPAVSPSHAGPLQRRPRPVACPSCRARLPATQHRGFHLPALATQAVEATEAAILHLHATAHTPWFVTIPLVALGISLVVRLPLAVQARSLAIARARLNPLLRAWGTVHTKRVYKERAAAEHAQRARQAASQFPLAETPVDTTPDALRPEILKRFKKTETEVHARFGVQAWKTYTNFLALPPWLVAIEAMRRLCGAPYGLLGLVLRRSPDTGTSLASDTTSTVQAVYAGAETSLASGGCLWFPDLTVADPYHVLPFALSAILITNVIPSTDAGRRALFGLDQPDGRPYQVAPMRRGLQRSLLLMSVGAGFATMNFPAAIHLYWISSSAWSAVIARILRYLWPMPEDPAAGSGLRQEHPWIMPPIPDRGAEAQNTVASSVQNTVESSVSEK